MTTPTPRRAGRPSGISSIGLTGAPSSAAPVAPIAPVPPPSTEQGSSSVASRPHDVTTSPRQRSSSAPKATASTTVSYTVRFDSREYLDVDRLIIGMKHETSRRSLDKSEIIRTLLRLAGEDPAVRAALLRELTAS